MALTADAAFENGNYTSPPAIGLKAFAMNYTSRLFDQKGYEEKLHLGLFGGLENDESYFQTLNDLFGGIIILTLLLEWVVHRYVRTETSSSFTLQYLLHILKSRQIHNILRQDMFNSVQS